MLAMEEPIFADEELVFSASRAGIKVEFPTGLSVGDVLGLKVLFDGGFGCHDCYCGCSAAHHCCGP